MIIGVVASEHMLRKQLVFALPKEREMTEYNICTIDNLRCENIVYRQTALDSAIKNNPVMSKSVEKRVLVQIQDIAKSLNLHCKMEDEHEATKEFQKNCMYNTGKKLMSK